MNKDIKARWVEALRSGEYVQAAGALRTGTGYCCLGVLCEIAVREGVIPAPTVVDAGTYIYAGAIAYLPPQVQTWADTDDRVRVGGALAHALNDDGIPFSTIADLIEEHL